MSPAITRCEAGTKDIGLATVLGCASPAILLAAACLLPLLNKAFLLDDPWFLAMARQILQSPLHPTNFDLCWNVPPYCAKAYEMGPGNTLMGYVLVPTILSGAAEWVAHATQLVFVWVAVIAMASFVLRMGWSKGYAISGALLLAAIPPLLPMATTATPDVLALTMGLVGIERLAAWKEERKWGRGAVAAIALGLAGTARPHAALLLPLAAFFLLDSTKPREVLLQIRQSLLLWVPVLAGGLILLVVIFATRERGLLLDPPASLSGLAHFKPNVRSYLLFLCFPLPLAGAWACARWTTSPRRVVLAILAATSLAFLLPWRPHGEMVLSLVGGYVLAELLWEAWKKGDRDGFFLWLWLLIPLPILFYHQFPIKYLLPSMPAVILICLRLGRALPARIARAAGALVIMGGVAYSLLILKADAESADFGRMALSALVRPHVLTGEKVWFPNSFYWYAQRAGAELVVPGVQEPERGELAVDNGADDTGALNNFPNRTLVATLTHRCRFGRTMGEGAGLYTNHLGNWLWTFRKGQDLRYALWRLN